MEDPNPIVWAPSVRDLQDSPLARFRDAVNKRYNLALSTYKDIHAWSVGPETRGDFWIAAFDFLDLGAIKAPSRAFINVSSELLVLSRCSN